jgi:hypothetical protein
MAMQVDPQHVHYELSAAKFSWDHPKGEQQQQPLANMHKLLPWHRAMNEGSRVYRSHC